MKTNLDCIYCIIQKADERCEKLNSDRDLKLKFMKNVFSLIGESKEDVTAPYLSKCVNDLLRNEFGSTEDYSMLKTKYNGLMLGLEETIEKEIHSDDNPLLSALRYAMVGNFIDFAAMDTINPEKLNESDQNRKNSKCMTSLYTALFARNSAVQKILFICSTTPVKSYLTSCL